jgi:hypothetical protein
MPVIKNVSPIGALDIPLLRRVVEFGEEVEVSVEQATVLLDQEANYEPVDKSAKAILVKIKAARAVVESDAPVEAPATTEDAPSVPDTSKDAA